jgi:hypothetical protein
MGAELPALAAVMARLAEPEINLAAYGGDGGAVFPLALIIEAPVIMLLAASTALSKDWASYLLLRRFTMRTGALLTALHVIVAFTPLYYVVVEGIIGVPQEIVEPARVGLMIMTPWTWAIAYRRFHQGVLIRFGHSRAVGVGTVLRLCADAVVLAIGYSVGTIPGIVVATSAVIAGVLTEAVYVGLIVQPVLRNQLRPAEPVEPPLTFRAFLDFYAPLAMTSLLILLVQPIGASALSRMPRALESLAVWSVVSGLVFMLRSLGIAYNEVVVALLDKPHSSPSLRRFATLLTTLTTLMIVIIAATPLATIWFGRVSGLSPALVVLAQTSLWLALPLPGLNVMQSWYQGGLVHIRSTRGVTEAMGIFLVITTAILSAGVAWGQIAGLYIGLVAFGAGSLTQTAWLWHRSRPVMRHLASRDAGGLPLQTASSPVMSK